MCFITQIPICGTVPSESGQNREAIYRDARLVQQQLQEGQQREQQLRDENRRLQQENEQLRQKGDRNPFTDCDKVQQYAATAQAEGVSLPVAQRLLKILQAPTRPRSVRSGGVHSRRR